MGLKFGKNLTKHMNIGLTFIKLISKITMKGFTGKTKNKLVEFKLDLLLPFYLNRYSSGVYNRPRTYIH
jgi:hypothetical protein